MIITNDIGDLIDWKAFQACRAQLGDGFDRILGYFQEDGDKSITAIEQAMRNKSAIALVNPAHMLKGEAFQFGAQLLGYSAERIEDAARQCIERRIEPDEVKADVVALRGLFDRTLELLEQETRPPAPRRRTFGQKVVGPSPSFGRL